MKSMTYKTVRNFSNIHSSAGKRKPGWRRRRFYRRLTISGLLFTAWFFIIDADFFTYYLDLHRRRNSSQSQSQSQSQDKLQNIKFLSNPNDTFKNKTIWVVGASSGIGEYIAYNLCQSPSHNLPKRIIISARRVNDLNRVANECNRINPKIEIIVKPLDVTSFSDTRNHPDFGDKYIADLMEEISDDIDILVLNAGMMQKCRAEYAEMDSFKSLAEINMFGPIGFAQSMVKQWRFNGYLKNKKKRHQIAVTSSFVGKTGTPGYAFYSLTKHGINGFFESMRIELQDDPIDVNLMCLGPIMPSNKTHPELGGKQDIKYIRKFTEKYGNITTLDRCAQLYVTALQYSLSEAWITCNPYLFYMYSRQYLPAIALATTNIFAKPFLREVQRADKQI